MRYAGVIKDHVRVVTVTAEDDSQARELIAAHLKANAPQKWLKRWREEGERVEPITHPLWLVRDFVYSMDDGALDDLLDLFRHIDIEMGAEYRAAAGDLWRLLEREVKEYYGTREASKQ